MLSAVTLAIGGSDDPDFVSLQPGMRTAGSSEERPERARGQAEAELQHRPIASA